MLNAARFELGRLRALTRRLQGERPPGEPRRATARVLCIASGKGGTGKSIVATNLASLRAERGERVCLVDFDAGLANAHLLLGLAPRHDLGHVLDGEVSAREALVESPRGFALLSGGVGRHALANPTRRELDRLFRALSDLESEFELIVVDHGAGLSYGTVAHLAATSTLLIVAGHEITALSDAYALYKRATMVNAHLRTGMVVNRVADQAQALDAWGRFEAAAKRFLGQAPELVGWVPQDEAVGESVQRRQPVSVLRPDSPSGRALRALASWGPIDHARTTTPFYDRARRALR
jgi:flagellar biosynthesis protein FlhG